MAGSSSMSCLLPRPIRCGHSAIESVAPFLPRSSPANDHARRGQRASRPTDPGHECSQPRRYSYPRGHHLPALSAAFGVIVSFICPPPAAASTDTTCSKRRAESKYIIDQYLSIRSLLVLDNLSNSFRTICPTNLFISGAQSALPQEYPPLPKLNSIAA